MGWWNYHLQGPADKDESEIRLDSVAGEGSKFAYIHDFGDWWRHKIVVEKVLPADSVATVPGCIDGRRACPPEDCGGTWGYGELLEVLATPSHPEYDERVEWIGRPSTRRRSTPPNSTRSSATSTRQRR